MPTRRCWVPNCTNNKVKVAENTRLFGFPSNVKRCREWLRSIGDPALVKDSWKNLTRYRFVCKEHFLESHITATKRTTENAVPSIFAKPCLPLPESCLREFEDRVSVEREQPTYQLTLLAEDYCLPSADDCSDETSLTSFSPLTSANYSPPKKIQKVDLQHIVERTTSNNACTPEKVINTRSTRTSKVYLLHQMKEITLIGDETPVSSPEEIFCFDNDQEDSNSCDCDILSSGHEEKKMTAVDTHQNQCISVLLVKDILPEQTLHECEDQVETLTDSCGRSREEDTNQKKETVMQKRHNLQPEVRGTSQRKEIVKQDKIDSQPEVKDMRQKKETMIQRKKNMQSSTFTRWRTDNLARKEKLRQRRGRNKIQFSTETVQKTVNDAVEGKWEMMENAINEKQRQDKTAMEKQWNQLEDRVSQIIEGKVENKLSQVIEDQLEKRINQIMERRGNKELHCTIEKRIGKILEEKMEKIEERITEVIDKKMGAIFWSLKSVTECRTVPDTSKWET